jgi:COP9 signalosome complex subunit 6
MADDSTPSNPLLTTKAPDAALNVQLHPLVLLTITDYITRHISRQQTNPIVGAIIGQQNGRNFTLEHAYECKTSLSDNTINLDTAWFIDRIEQYKDVHKAPALDLVGLFTLGGIGGPEAHHVGVVKQVQQLTGMDAVMVVLFHAEMVEQLSGGKLPISLYESVVEQQEGGAVGGDAEIKFRELAFEVETGEAEMIGVDFVATGGGNATAVPKATADTGAAGGSASTSVEANGSKDKEKKGGKGKGKAKEDDADGEEATDILSPEDEELIASLTAKANAIKMLNQRINLIREYLKTLPTSYLTDTTSTEAPAENTNYTLLRSINAMLSRLPLLAPPTSSQTPSADTTQPQTEIPQQPTLTSAAAKEKEDVHLTTLLASLTRSIAEAQSMGSKFGVVSKERSARSRSNMGMGMGGMGGGRGYSDMGGLLTEDTPGF